RLFFFSLSFFCFIFFFFFFFFSSRRRHTRFSRDWSSDVCSSDLGAPHISLYMLEVDEDSRLGREVLSAGSRYGAATTPDEDRIRSEERRVGKECRDRW